MGRGREAAQEGLLAGVQDPAAGHSGVEAALPPALQGEGVFTAVLGGFRVEEASLRDEDSPVLSGVFAPAGEERMAAFWNSV